jgi:hypothetical protein
MLDFLEKGRKTLTRIDGFKIAISHMKQARLSNDDR